MGVTTNPAIFDHSITTGAADYAEQIRDLAIRGVDVGEAVRALTAFDVRWACDLFTGVYEATAGSDGRVSIEVDPRLAPDTDGTIAEAKALWWLVDRPNLLVKIPATKEGLPAITAVLGEGISVNVTLIFSGERYGEVIDAYLDGLEQYIHAHGAEPSKVASVASFFISRVDTEVDRRLDAIGSDQALALRGQAAVAQGQLAGAMATATFAGPRWERLVAHGASFQRPLWASTSWRGITTP